MKFSRLMIVLLCTLFSTNHLIHSYSKKSLQKAGKWISDTGEKTPATRGTVTTGPLSTAPSTNTFTSAELSIYLKKQKDNLSAIGGQITFKGIVDDVTAAIKKHGINYTSVLITHRTTHDTFKFVEAASIKINSSSPTVDRDAFKELLAAVKNNTLQPTNTAGETTPNGQSLEFCIENTKSPFYGTTKATDIETLKRLYKEYGLVKEETKSQSVANLSTKELDAYITDRTSRLTESTFTELTEDVATAITDRGMNKAYDHDTYKFIIKAEETGISDPNKKQESMKKLLTAVYEKNLHETLSAPTRTSDKRRELKYLYVKYDVVKELDGFIQIKFVNDMMVAIDVKDIQTVNNSDTVEEYLQAVIQAVPSKGEGRTDDFIRRTAEAFYVIREHGINDSYSWGNPSTTKETKNVIFELNDGLNKLSYLTKNEVAQKALLAVVEAACINRKNPRVGRTGKPLQDLLGSNDKAKLRNIRAGLLNQVTINYDNLGLAEKPNNF